MVAVSRGDTASLDALFSRHHRRLYGFLVRLTGDRDLADDLVQDVFLRLLRFRASYRADGQFVPWLFRIARNAAADRHQEVRRGTEKVAADDSAPDNDPAPLDRLISHEEQQQLERVPASLPLAHREVLLLRGTERLSHRDLAIALHCSEGAARVRLHRALAALKRAWFATAGEPR